MVCGHYRADFVVFKFATSNFGSIGMDVEAILFQFF